MTTTPSGPAPRPRCPAFHQRVRTSAVNLQFRFSDLSPEPKMPSCGNKLKSQLGTRKYLLHWEKGHREAQDTIRAAQGLVCVSKQQAQHTTELLKRPQRSIYTQRNLDIKVHFLMTSSHWANCCSGVYASGSRGDPGESPKYRM